MKHIINASCTSLKANGFINYFGLQRFGKGLTKSHIIGREIILGNYQQACNCFFDKPVEIVGTEDVGIVGGAGSSKTDWDKINTAYYNGKYQEALDACSYKMYAEKKILESLLTYPKDYPRAFHCIPKHLRSLCLHAYQSYLWNKVVSQRVGMGLQVVVGDVVSLHGKEVQVVDDALDIVEDTADIHDSSASDATTTAAVNTLELHVVDEKDVQEHRFTMNDIVVPLLGHNSIVTDLYKPMFEVLLIPDGLSVEAMISSTLSHLKGGYRKVIQVPSVFTHNIIEYTDMNEDLVHTELKPSGAASTNNSHTNIDTVTDTETIKQDEMNNNKYVALHIQFSLSSGSYATMMLRELMKQGTDTQFHAKMTQEFQQEVDDMKAKRAKIE